MEPIHSSTAFNSSTPTGESRRSTIEANPTSVSSFFSLSTPLLSGAAPAMQIATSALGLKHGVIPPTVNWVHPDPACPFNLSGAARPFGHAVTMVNAHGLAGVNSSFILEKC